MTPLEVQKELYAPERVTAIQSAPMQSMPLLVKNLVVSVNTVRTQVQSIYRKLNVNNRVAASEIARDLKLL